MKGFMHWNPVHSWKDSCLQRVSNLDPYISRSSLIWVCIVFSNHSYFLDFNTVNSGCLKVEVNLQLLISQSKFSGLRKFTLIYQYV